MEKDHTTELQQFCRVCANKIKKGYKHKCSDSGDLLKPFGIHVATDKAEVHPPHYCRSCHTTAKRLVKAGGLAETALQVHIWSPHSETQCEVCSMESALHSAGRKRKEAKKRGRPRKESKKATANTILKSAPESWKAVEPPLFPAFFLQPPASCYLTSSVPFASTL